MADTPYEAFTDVAAVEPTDIGIAMRGAGGVNYPLSVFIHLRADGRYHAGADVWVNAGNTVTVFETDLTRANRLITGADATGAFINSTYGSGGTGDLRVLCAGVERARFLGDGRVAIGNTGQGISLNEKFSVTGGGTTAITGSVSDTSKAAAAFWNSATSGDNRLVDFYTDGGSLRGSIGYNRAGGTVAFNTTSDYRSKDVLGPIDADKNGAMIDRLRPVVGRMHGATSERPMLVAHEVAEAGADYAVTGEKDAVNESGEPSFQQLDVSALIPALIAEIQALRARVASLEG